MNAHIAKQKKTYLAAMGCGSRGFIPMRLLTTVEIRNVGTAMSSIPVDLASQARLLGFELRYGSALQPNV